MKKFSTLYWLAATSLGMFVAVVIADTVPLRGTNEAAGLRMQISMPPPLPTNTVFRPRLREIAPDIYMIEYLEPDDIIFSVNEPKIRRTKGGWRLTFQ